jgi:hypothetical protein
MIVEDMAIETYKAPHLADKDDHNANSTRMGKVSFDGIFGKVSSDPSPDTYLARLTSEQHRRHHLVAGCTDGKSNVGPDVPPSDRGLLKRDQKHCETSYAQGIGRIRKPEVDFWRAVNALLRPAIAEEIKHWTADQLSDDAAIDVSVSTFLDSRSGNRTYPTMLLMKFNPIDSKSRLNLTPSKPGISTQIRTEQNANMTL